MATLVLQTVGSVVGGAVGGPLGSVAGRLAGGLGGSLIDRALAPHASPRYSIGPRLESMDGIASTEGAGVPRVYGRARIGGQMIWATRFLERVNATFESAPRSGKGSSSSSTQSVTFTYVYSANFAIGLCEGPIAFVRRIWADGVELDMSTLPIRIYAGTQEQEPDPLIVAKEGAGNVPAYRGLAYIVFEGLALASFGNRIPQFTFEVVKPVAGIGEMIRGVDIIPGATEAGYLPSLKLNFWSPGVTNAENRHQLTAQTDWQASIDALQALCPNLESVALVVTWFGDDLRAQYCNIEPRVDSRFKTIGEFDFVFGPFWPPDWSVAGKWASPSIDFIGVDVYWPLSDWRDGNAHLDAQIATSVTDLDYLASRVAAGEGYDWYYADSDARGAQNRTPITDGLGKPWVYRQKDFLSFWSLPHYERVGGAELTQSTAWVPQSKPIWITETGCPAVDRGANAPNVFPDARSSEGGLPYFSRDGRDDLMQARFIEAMISHFDPSRTGGAAANPTSNIYGGPMVDPARIHIWCWDARPFPAFPTQSAAWSDGPNWETGHWLNGRLEGAPLDRLLTTLAGAVSAPGLEIERPNMGGFIDGYTLDRPMSPRDAMDPLAALYGFDAIVAGGKLRFVDRRASSTRDIGEDDLVPGKDMSLVTLTRAQESDLPHEIALSYGDSENDYQTARVLSRRLEGRSIRQSEAQAAVMIHRSEAQRLADIWLQDLWIGRDTAEFSLRPGLVDLQPGDTVRLGAAAGGRLFQIQRITDGAARTVSARAVDPTVYDVPPPKLYRHAVASPQIIGPPRVVVLDLALVRDSTALSYVAAFADPWPGPLAIVKGANSGASQVVGTIEKRATIGDTLDALAPGPVGRFDNGSSVTVRLGGGALASVDDLVALSGRAAMAIRGPEGAWEIFAFARAELVADKTYRLSRLIRGLGGEEYLAARVAPAGSTVVLLDDSLVPLARNISDIGAPITYAIGPADRDMADPLYVRATVTATGKTLRPYAPTRVRATRTPAGIVIDFVRRSRIDSDAWEAVDVRLGEANEAYEADIVLPTGVRTLSATTPSIVYPAAQELADFGAPQSALAVSLYQMSATVGRGFPFTGALAVQ